jgi:hypothetical protein
VPLTTSADYPDIRGAIDVSLDADSLPDTVIGLDRYIGRAERWVAERTTDVGDHAKQAVISRCAALLVPHIPNITSESRPGFSYQRQALDVEMAVGQLNADALEEIDLANGGDSKTSLDLRPTIFSAANGCRGR